MLQRKSWAAYVILSLASSFAWGADPPPKTDRILNAKKPGWTNPILDEKAATDIGKLEQDVKSIADNQDKLRTGRLNQEDFDKSLSEVKQHISEIAVKNPESAPVQASAARAYIQAGDNAKAINRATQAMSLAPADPFPVTTRSLAYFKAKDYPKAASDAKKALELDPDNSAARALYLLSKDRPAGGTLLDASAPRLRHALETMALPPSPYTSAIAPPSRPSAYRAEPRPDDPPELARYKTEAGRNYARQIIAAESALKRKDYLTAYGAANAAMTTYADNPRVMATRAVAAFGLQDFKTALGDATRVLGARPNFAPMLTTKAAALNEMSRHAEALRDAQKAIALSPTPVGRAYLERAIAREGLQEAPAGVLEDYRQAAELDPELKPDYLQALARLASGRPGGTVAAASTQGSETAANPPKALAGLLSRAGPLQPMHLYGFAGLMVLAAAGMVLMRRG